MDINSRLNVLEGNRDGYKKKAKKKTVKLIDEYLHSVLECSEYSFFFLLKFSNLIVPKRGTDVSSDIIKVFLTNSGNQIDAYSE